MPHNQMHEVKCMNILIPLRVVSKSRVTKICKGPWGGKRVKGRLTNFFQRFEILTNNLCLNL